MQSSLGWNSTSKWIELARTLHTRYRNEALGEVKVISTAQGLWFDFGGWKSEVATLDNRDGSFTLTTISPGTAGFTFVAFDRKSGRTLAMDDEQREYVFDEVN